MILMMPTTKKKTREKLLPLRYTGVNILNGSWRRPPPPPSPSPSPTPLLSQGRSVRTWTSLVMGWGEGGGGSGFGLMGRWVWWLGGRGWVMGEERWGKGGGGGMLCWNGASSRECKDTRAKSHTCARAGNAHVRDHAHFTRMQGNPYTFLTHSQYI